MLVPTNGPDYQPTAAMIAAEKCVRDMALITDKLQQFTLRLEKETKELVIYRETMVAENQQLIEQAKKNAEEFQAKQISSVNSIKASHQQAQGSLAAANVQRTERIETLVKQAQDEKALQERQAHEIAQLRATIANLQ